MSKRLSGETYAVIEDCVEKFSENTGISKRKSRILMKQCLDSIKQVTVESGELRMKDFLMIKVVHKNTDSRDLWGKGEVEIPEHNVLVVKAGKGFKNMINNK
jgi:nucleoid DNA-binding protein